MRKTQTNLTSKTRTIPLRSHREVFEIINTTLEILCSFQRVKKSSFDGVKRGLKDFDCDFRVLTTPQIVDVVARFAYIHTIADFYLHNEKEIEDEAAFKMTAIIEETIKKKRQTRYD